MGELLFAAAHDGDQEAVEKHWANAKSSDLEYINEKVGPIELCLFLSLGNETCCLRLTGVLSAGVLSAPWLHPAHDCRQHGSRKDCQNVHCAGSEHQPR